MKHKQKVNVYWMEDLGPVVRAEDYQAVCDEAEALARDAERYRFIRSPNISHIQHNQLLYAVDNLSKVLMDQAIDEAMQGK